MTWKIWILFTAMHATLSLTPGPAVLLVLSQALSRGASKSIWSSLGILSANLFYFVLSATSLGALLLASYRVFFAVKWLGAAYLIYLGIRALTGKTVLVVTPAGRTNSLSDWRIFLNGFALQAANPKALVYFTALLPQFVNPDRAIAPQIGLLAVTATVIEFVILAGYGILAGKASRFARTPRFAAATNRLSGVMLIGVGAGLAAVHRD
jgi:homoserine/homoserine lactone efflux protein